ncbi:MAG: branched-chain amino acid ABC transporter permease [Actinomycetia bacterium]|nr:branched-chain amino acid ABC transporter permease [Actinomycetes bacterium]
MGLFLQRCFDGSFNGAIYASLAVAIVMIYRSTGLLNFAQGEMAMVSGYLALVLLSAPGAAGFGFSLAGTEWAARWIPWHPWPVPVAIVAAVLFGAGLGAAIEGLIMRRLDDSTALSQVNVTIGLLILLNGVTLWIWGPYARTFPSPFPNGIADFLSVGGARLRYTTIGVWAVLLVVIGFLGWLVRHTKTGLAFRALTSNREAAALVGVPIGRTLTVGWAIAAGIGALAACLVGGAIVLEPLTMMKMLIYALAAATIGGLDSPAGAIVGGIIVGLTQALVPGYLGVPNELSLLPPLAVMVLVLILRPHGLFGTVPVSRV